jgi:hypothetical protein
MKKGVVKKNLWCVSPTMSEVNVHHEVPIEALNSLEVNIFFGRANRF